MSQQTSTLFDESHYVPSNPQGPSYRSRLKISLACWCIAMSVFQNGYWMVYIQQISIATLKQLYSIDLGDSTTSGILNGCIPIGALFGALSSRIFISKFSRRYNILLTNVLAFAANTLTFVHHFPFLLCSRLCQGFCVGIYSTLAPLMIRQLAPKEILGTLGSYVQFNICFGASFGCIFSYSLQKITGDESGADYWQYMFGFPILFLALQTILLGLVFPFETPKYWLSKDNEEECRKLVEWIYKKEYVQEVIEQKKLDLESLRKKIEESPSELNPPRSCLPLVVAIHATLLVQFSGINAVVVYGGKIARSAVNEDLASLMSSLINFDQLLAILVASFMLARLGRRTILLFGTFIEIIANGLIAIGCAVKDEQQYGTTLIFVGLFLFMADFGLSIGSATWIYIAEIVEPSQVAFSVAANWIGASIVIIAFPIITDELLDGNPGIAFIAFMSWCAFSLFFNYFLMVQTRGKSEKEIRQGFEKLKICE